MRLRNIVLVLLSLLAGAVLVLGFIIFAAYGEHDAESVRIPGGSSLLRISDILEDAGVVRNAWIFMTVAKISGKGNRLQSGHYVFPESASMPEVLGILSRGSHQIDISVTIPEGLVLEQIASIMQARTGADSASFVQLTKDRDFILSLGFDVLTLEGYLLPETYRFRPGASEEQVIRKMVDELETYLSPDLLARMVMMKRSLHEILTVASIVEGETSLPEERSRVAGVYYNRMERGMLLQADPTIQYIVPGNPRRILYRDLRRDSPYHTYKYAGLPPGPVNNPGRESIHAAIYPEKHNFLYFVADGKGGHRFSRNAQEHQEAVTNYRRYRRRSR